MHVILYLLIFIATVYDANRVSWPKMKRLEQSSTQEREEKAVCGKIKEEKKEVRWSWR